MADLWCGRCRAREAQRLTSKVLNAWRRRLSPRHDFERVVVSGHDFLLL